MTQQELLAASQQRLLAYADFLGLRSVGARRTYWIRKQARHPITGRDHSLKRSMRTADLRTAVLRAAPIVEAWLAQVQTTLAPAVTDLPAAYPTLGAVLAVYLAWPHGQPTTRRRNAAELRRIVAAVHGGEPDRLSVEVVDARLARTWLQAQQAAAAKAHLPQDREAFERAKRARNQTLAQAQSVFSRRAVQHVRDSGLSLPDSVVAFAAELGLEARPAPPPEAFSEAEQQAIADGLPALREADPATYAALRLMLFAGLRTREVVSACWGWVGRLGEHAALDLSTRGAWEPKGRDGWVLVADDLLRDLPCLHYPPAPGDPLVPAAEIAERQAAAYRRLNAYLSDCGVRKVNGKLGYRARGHAITRIYLEAGADAAREFARHRAQRTTDRYYRGAKIPYSPLSIQTA